MQTFDFYLSLGPACRPARYIQYHNLRSLAAPLDWQFRYSLKTALKLFNTSFSTFFTTISDNKRKDGANNCRRVTDTKNHITSIHHFSKDISLEEGHRLFLESMSHRYEMLDLKLKQISNLAIVCNRTIRLKPLEHFLVEFSKIYPHLNITLIHILSNRRMKNGQLRTYTYSISPKLSIIQYQFNDFCNSITKEKYTWLGNEKQWNSIFENYDLTDYMKEIELLQGKQTVIYGLEELGLQTLEIMKKYNISVQGIISTASEANSTQPNNLSVLSLDTTSTDNVVLIALKDSNAILEAQNMLEEKGFHKIVTIDFSHGAYLNAEDLRKL